MKTILMLVTVLFSVGAFAQPFDDLIRPLKSKAVQQIVKQAESDLAVNHQADSKTYASFKGIVLAPPFHACAPSASYELIFSKSIISFNLDKTTHFECRVDIHWLGKTCTADHKEQFKQGATICQQISE